MTTIEKILESAWETRDNLTKENASLDVRESVAEAIDLLDSGSARVAEPVGETWRVNQWLKKAVLLSFRLAENTQIEGNYTHYFDKVPSKFDGFSFVCNSYPGVFKNLVFGRDRRRPLYILLSLGSSLDRV